MKQIKVLISLLLVVVMCVPAFAVDAKAGETVSATISFTSTEACSFGIAFTLPSELKLISSSASVGLVGPSRWGAYGTTPITSATLTFVFEVPSTAKVGDTYVISATLEEASNSAGNDCSATTSVTGATIVIVGEGEHEHVWDEGKVTKEPTCGETGVKTYTCTICGETKTEEIPATGEHKWDDGKVTKAATCVEAGVKLYTCTVCSATKTEEIPATGEHKWDDGKVTKAATCTEDGEMTYTCTVCGAVRTEKIPAAGEHKWDDGKVTTAPACETPGVRTYTCTVCGETKTESIPAAGHKWDDGAVTVEPSCKPGEKTYTCTVCGAVKTEEIPANGKHSWDEGKVTKEPTCVDEGEKTYTCSICGEKYTEAIDATGVHTWDEGKVTTAPTDTTPGVKTFTCKVCGATRTEEIAPTGEHIWDDGKVTKEATCGEPGVMTYTCTLCGATYTKAIPATGAHTWDGGKVVREATCTIPGKITYTCKVCGAVKSGLIPELGHKPVLKNAVKATQTMAGYSGDLVCSVCGTVLELGHRISPVGELNPWTLIGGIPKIPKQEEPKAEEPKPVVKEVKEEEDALPFKDVAKTDSFYDDVKFVFKNGIMNGVSATEFAPFSTLTRAMIVTILYRVEGEPLVPYTGAFTDVEDGTWYTYGVEWAAANGIVNGYGEGKYGPNDAVTLEQLAAILNRYAVFKGYKIEHAVEVSGTVSDWAVDNVNWAVGNAILEKTTTYTIPALRYEVAAAIHAFCVNVAK